MSLFLTFPDVNLFFFHRSFYNNRSQHVNAATQLELDVDVFLDFLSEVETSTNEGEILGDLYMYLLDEYQSGKARGANAVSPRR